MNDETTPDVEDVPDEVPEDPEIPSEAPPEPMTRDEHIAWCKERALEYLDRGELHVAYASLVSDLGKRDDTEGHPAIEAGAALLFKGQMCSDDQMRELIESVE